MPTTVVTYRLRTGPIIPSLNDCGAHPPDTFIMQTFGVERITTDVYDAKTTLLKSSDMQGQRPGNVEDSAYIATSYVSAAYQARGLKTTDGDLVFTATEEHTHEWTEEEEIGL